jgi:hypothetical protein
VHHHVWLPSLRSHKGPAPSLFHPIMQRLSGLKTVKQVPFDTEIPLQKSVPRKHFSVIHPSSCQQHCCIVHTYRVREVYDAWGGSRECTPLSAHQDLNYSGKKMPSICPRSVCLPANLVSSLLGSQRLYLLDLLTR